MFGFWPPMLYFVFIVLSTLRLDFWLSLWTGAVAAVQQFAAGRWLILLPMSVADDCRSRRWSTISAAASCCWLPGVVAGIVAGSLRRQFEKSVAAAAARDRVTNLFGQHVSPAVVDQLLASHERSAERDARGLRAVPRHPRLHGHDRARGRPTRPWRC